MSAATRRCARSGIVCQDRPRAERINHSASQEPPQPEAGSTQTNQFRKVELAVESATPFAMSSMQNITPLLNHWRSVDTSLISGAAPYQGDSGIALIPWDAFNGRAQLPLLSHSATPGFFQAEMVSTAVDCGFRPVCCPACCYWFWM